MSEQLYSDIDEELTLDDPPAENRKPLHVWQRADHESIDSMSAARRGEIKQDKEPPASVDEHYEQSLLDAGIPEGLLDAIMTAIVPARERENAESQTEVIRQIVFSFNGVDGEAFLRALGFGGDESLRDAAKRVGGSKSTLARLTQRLAEKCGKLLGQPHA